MIFDMPEEQSSIIKVIGVGGGGNNAVNYMFEQGISGVNFVVLNTDAQALEMSPVPNRIQLGPTLTNGRGAGSMPEVGKNATLESEEEIRDLLSINTKMVFVTAGMGGGTGTGGAPVVARIAKELGLLTVGIVTIPFEFEGKRKRDKAEQGLLEMKKNVDAMIVISNNKLRDIYGNLSLTQAFGNADSVLSTAAKGISEIITKSGMINVDFEDVRTVMTDSGVALMGTGIASGESRAIQAVDAAMSSPLLNDDDIHGAKGILLNITSGSEEIRMDEVTHITEYVQQAAANDTEIIWGVCYDDALEDEIAVTLIATGFDSKKLSSKLDVRQKVVHTLGEEGEKIVVEEVKKEEPVADLHPSPADPEEEGRDEDEIEIVTYPSKPDTIITAPEPSKPSSTMFFLNDNEEVEEEAVPETDNSIKDVAVLDPEEYEFTMEAEATPELSKTPPVSEDKSDDFSLELFSNADTSEQTVDQSKPDGPTHRPNMADIQRERMMKLKNIVSFNKIKSNQNLRDMENEPAYVRKNVEFGNVQHSTETNMSKYTLDNNEGQPEIRENNSFLHDNVD
ncbi:MAG: cell division protein FtsZ [Bacteroidetes bacterium]|nr:cell division protein FtsZ [Bacteroidota bacterium]